MRRDTSPYDYDVIVQTNVKQAQCSLSEYPNIPNFGANAEELIAPTLL